MQNSNKIYFNAVKKVIKWKENHCDCNRNKSIMTVVDGVKKVSNESIIICAVWCQ